MVRFYVKKVHPELEIYASPVNIDPASPALPICSPQHYAPELTEALGRFYTQGLPADTKALSEGSLSSAEFWSQAQLVLAESQRALDFELSRFQDGCLVFYFSSIDQCSHMLMRCMDPSHPLFEPNASAEVKQAIKFLYKAMDHALGRALEKVDARTTFFALSDHGFTSFTREFHLSTWLYEQGFLKVTRPERVHDMEFYRFVNWGDTQAYALGINGIYINRKGREKNGSISESAVQGIKEQIAKQLLQVIDPKTGKRVVREVYDSEKLYSGPFTSLAPDLLVGYAPGYRISDEAILGKFPQGIVGDRTDPWASDHCMDPSAVPGVFLCNHKIQNQSVAIWDLAPSILKVFGVPQPESMTGKAIIDI
jgi:predicted AlkP superfamily phosphohydrolase/phosphomutase